MKLVVASGKGGTGKTTVSVNLAVSLGKCTLVDCDVEEPNDALFLGDPRHLEDVTVLVPEFDLEKCTLCGECAEFCRYKAIATIPPKLLYFDELCHSCGGCAIICPVDAVSEKPKMIGEVRTMSVGDIDFYDGRLSIGEPAASPVIRRLNAVDYEGLAIYDSPPGTACPVLETLKRADFALLVTEPTPFGLNDLKLAVDVVRAMDIPIGVVINRDGIGDSGVEDYCAEDGIEIMMRIPEDRRIAELYSEGRAFADVLDGYGDMFRGLMARIEAVVR